ncbi:MAG: PQQ-binding-like beta-propeller repeat protein [Deltaproteobacteria bacterium]|nr:PQQ-binding-like beta-propeller repeat protein [Deltaproteobacteria bacterium]
MRQAARRGAASVWLLALWVGLPARAQDLPDLQLRREDQFAADAQHTGRSALRGPRTAPSIRWRVRARRRVFASPMVDPDGYVVFAGIDGRVRAVDLEGVVRWSFAAPSYVFATPARVSTGIIAGYNGGAFVALNGRGHVQWRHAVADDADCSPTVGRDDALYLAARGVSAVHGRTGEARWRWEGPRVLGSVALSPDESQVIVIPVDHILRWLDARNGRELRRVLVPSLVESAPLVLDDGVVVVGSEDGHVRAYRPDATLLWDHALSAPVRSTPTFARDRSVVVGGDDLHVRALDPATGNERWSVRTGGFVRAAATIDRDGWIYVGSEDDRLYAIGPDGALRWSLTMSADLDDRALIVQDGVMAVGTDDGALYLLRE